MPRSRCISLKNKVKSQMQEINKTAVLIFSVLTLCVGIASAALTGDFGAYKEMRLPEGAPFGFFLVMLWTFMYLLIGAALGGVISSRDKCRECYKWRGVLYFCAMLALNFLWPPFFFGMGLYFCAFILLCTMLIFSFFAILCFYKVYPICAWALFIYWIWLAYLSYFNLAVVFLN